MWVRQKYHRPQNLFFEKSLGVYFVSVNWKPLLSEALVFFHYCVYIVKQNSHDIYSFNSKRTASMKTSSLILAASTLLISTLSFAEHEVEDNEHEPYWELLLFGGTAELNTDNTTITTYDYLPADKIKQNNEGSWKSWTIQAGVGYVVPLFGAERLSDEVQWFPAIEPQLNVYYLKGNVDGNVDRYYKYPDVDPSNDTGYKMDIESTRLMLDVALTFVSWRNVSLYGIAGIGPSWNRVGFHGKENDCVEAVNLSQDTTTNFAYEFGGGLSYLLNEHLSLTAEYLYTGFNDIAIGDSGHLGNGAELSDVDSKDFDLHSQAVFAGFRLAF